MRKIDSGAIQSGDAVVEICVTNQTAELHLFAINNGGNAEEAQISLPLARNEHYATA